MMALVKAFTFVFIRFFKLFEISICDDVVVWKTFILASIFGIFCSQLRNLLRLVTWLSFFVLTRWQQRVFVNRMLASNRSLFLLPKDILNVIFDCFHHILLVLECLVKVLQIILVGSFILLLWSQKSRGASSHLFRLTWICYFWLTYFTQIYNRYVTILRK